ncbi:MAG: hypothetical protein ACKVZJ_11275 [Phycisphaerales bacterium]
MFPRTSQPRSAVFNRSNLGISHLLVRMLRGLGPAERAARAEQRARVELRLVTVSNGYHMLESRQCGEPLIRMEAISTTSPQRERRVCDRR